jgi:hypothetical protein
MRANSSGQLILNNNYAAPCSMDALDLRVNENRVLYSYSCTVHKDLCAEEWHGHCFVISGWILDSVQFISGQISNRELIALCDLNSNKEPSRNSALPVRTRALKFPPTFIQGLQVWAVCIIFTLQLTTQQEYKLYINLENLLSTSFWLFILEVFFFYIQTSLGSQRST